MSEAETPNNRSDLFESNSSQDALAPAEPRTKATLPEWVTVTFPDAIGVDDVPRTPEPSQAGLRIQDLENQNQKLVARITELTAALNTAQTARKADLDRHAAIVQAQSEAAQKRFEQDAQLIQQQAALIIKQRQALDAAKQRLSDQELQLIDRAQELRVAHDRVMQLSQDLDRAAQAEHKQQILIETLTAQLEASQTQVAQLERDCALTKQRYDEQIQLVRQTETACRDLRSRLHRQQQYTLQFKAALEKCLDVPVAQGNLPIVPMTAERNTEASTSKLAIVPREELSAHCFVKAQPVQPWSASPEFLPPPELRPEPTLELLEDSVPTQSGSSENPFSDLSNLEELWSDSTESPQNSIPAEVAIAVSETDSTTALSEAKSTLPLSYTIHRSMANSTPPPQSLTLFTPPVSEPPVLEIGSITPEVEPILSRSELPAIAAFEDVIEPAALEVENLAIEQPESENQPDLSIAAIEDAEVVQPLTIAEPSDLDAAIAQASQSSEVQIQPERIQPSPFITLNSATIGQPIRGEELPLTDALEHSPSPIVYPDRAQKKIPSLAAVELPSFPKAGK